MLKKIFKEKVNTPFSKGADIVIITTYEQATLSKSCRDLALPCLPDITQDDILVWCDTHIQIILLNYFP